MANINSLTNSTSSTSSLYGNRNILSGLASGLDTESMIENSISGYKTKISTLEQKQTKLTWKQDAYRAVTDPVAAFVNKYTSYTSKTNLMSNSFFTGNTTTTAQGANASAVSAVGKASSNVQITSISSLATAAQYRVSAENLGVIKNAYSTTGGQINLSGDISRSLINGSLTLSYGGQSIDLDFSKNDAADAVQNTAQLAERIRTKLNDIDIKSGVSTKKAGELIDVSVDADGNISFSATNADKSGSAVWISGASGNFKSVFGIESNTTYTEDVPSSFSTAGKTLSQMSNVGELVNGSEVDITLNGTNKTITLTMNGDHTAFDAADIQRQLDSAFGANMVNFSFDHGRISFDTGTAADSMSTLRISAAEGKALGFENGMSNYVNTDATLSSLMGGSMFDFGSAPASGYSLITVDADNVSKETNGNTRWYDETNGIAYDKSGNLIKQAANDDWVRVDKDGGVLYSFDINGKSVGAFGQNTSIQDIMDTINSGADFNVSYSSMTNQFSFTSKTTGEGVDINFDSPLSQALFDSADAVKTAGTNARFTALVDGQAVTLSRTSNTVNMDGMSVTLKNTFNIDADGNALINNDGSLKTGASEAISFSTTSNADGVMETIQKFVEEYNEIVKQIHDAYATQPLEKSSKTHARYEPLTDSDKDGMSESAISSYEEKAKQGILFGDSDLSAFYNKLNNLVSIGSTASDLRAIGIESTYSNGVSQLTINEDTLRSALENNPDKVKNVFSNTSSTTGLMSNMKDIMDNYASTSYSSPGVLVRKAGSKLSATSLLNNEVQKQIDSVQTQIERWQSKMSTKIDYYTRQFTALEQLMNTMNSQSSAFAGLMGGY